MNSNHKLSLEMQQLISKELELNGVHFDRYPWLGSKNVIEESVMALIPSIHEGKISSSGTLFVETTSDLEQMDVFPFEHEQIELARKMADGKEWFLLYEKNIFYGLARFRVPLRTELQLIRNFPLTAGLVIQRESSGVTKFYQGDGITIHDNRRWFTKPNIKEASWKVSQCVANVDKKILSRILEFAFHLMSPSSGVGGIIVWYLTPPFDVSNHLSSLNFSILDESHARLLCNTLSETDGATFLDPKGNLMETGVHLKYSEKSRELVPELKGTRHTSSARFSYDTENAIVVTISEDGPVTVFLNGANIADLQIYSASKKARLLSDKHPAKQGKVTSRSAEVICETCGKKSMIEQVNMEGMDEMKQVFCPTCQKKLYSASCSSLERRPFKLLMIDSP